MIPSFDLSTESNFDSLCGYNGYFDRNYHFGRKCALEESTNVNDIPLMIADMLISGGYFRIGDVNSAALTFGKAEKISSDFDGVEYYPKFTVTAQNLSDMDEYNAYQAVWDFAIAREFVIGHNPIYFSSHSSIYNYYVQDDTSDNLDGYINDEDNYDVETIYADLLNSGYDSSITYDGDFRKILDYNLAFSYDVNRNDAIKAIMDAAAPAAKTLAHRQPSANPFNFYSFEFVLVNTPQGAWTQMPVLPRLTAEEEKE